MNAEMQSEIETLQRTAQRLERAGLVVDRAALSKAHRRALFAFQCKVVDGLTSPPQEEKIGFKYPNAR